jgi:hypothetical protein
MHIRHGTGFGLRLFWDGFPWGGGSFAIEGTRYYIFRRIGVSFLVFFLLSFLFSLFPGVCAIGCFPFSLLFIRWLVHVIRRLVGLLTLASHEGRVLFFPVCTQRSPFHLLTFTFILALDHALSPFLSLHALIQPLQKRLKLLILFPRNPIRISLMLCTNTHHIEFLRDLEVRFDAVAGGTEAFGGVPAELGEVGEAEAGRVCAWMLGVESVDFQDGRMGEWGEA